MKQKRAEKSAKNIKWSAQKVRRISIIVLIVIIFVWLYFALTNAKNFPIKTVQVKGDYQHVSTTTLQDTIKPFAKSSFFALQATALQDRLQQLPWIANANVRRVFPSTLIITLQEKQPVAIWNNSALLTKDGVLFSPEKSTYPQNLPYLNGPDDAAQNLLTTMQQINNMLQPLNLTVQQLMLSPRESWQLVLSDGIKVTIGQRDMASRLQQLITVFPKIIGEDGDKVASVDLRYPNGMAIQWKRGAK